MSPRALRLLWLLCVECRVLLSSSKKITSAARLNFAVTIAPRRQHPNPYCRHADKIMNMKITEEKKVEISIVCAFVHVFVLKLLPCGSVATAAADKFYMRYTRLWEFIHTSMHTQRQMECEIVFAVEYCKANIHTTRTTVPTTDLYVMLKLRNSAFNCECLLLCICAPFVSISIKLHVQTTVVTAHSHLSKIWNVVDIFGHFSTHRRESLSQMMR